MVRACYSRVVVVYPAVADWNYIRRENKKRMCVTPKRIAAKHSWEFFALRTVSFRSEIERSIYCTWNRNILHIVLRLKRRVGGGGGGWVLGVGGRARFLSSSPLQYIIDDDKWLTNVTWQYASIQIAIAWVANLVCRLCKYTPQQPSSTKLRYPAFVFMYIFFLVRPIVYGKYHLVSNVYQYAFNVCIVTSSSNETHIGRS